MKSCTQTSENLLNKALKGALFIFCFTLLTIKGYSQTYCAPTAYTVNSSLAAVISGTATGTGLTGCGGGTIQKEGWWSFTAAGNENYSISATCGTATANLYIQVLTGTVCGAMTEVSCANTYGAGVNTENVTFLATSGQVYYVRLCNIGANVNMNISSFAIYRNAPGNNCTTAPTISLNACNPLVGTDVGAPNFSGIAFGCSANPVVREGWYTFVVPAGASQNISINAISLVTNASDLGIQVFQGACAIGNLVGCANNVVGAIAQTENYTFTTGVLGSATTFFVRLVNVSTTSTGVMVLSSSAGANGICIYSSAAGASCNTAPLLTYNACNPTSYVISTPYVATVNATLNNVGALVGCSASTISKEGWFQFTVPAGAAQNISIAATNAASVYNVDLSLQVYQGTCGGLSELYTCANLVGANTAAATEVLILPVPNTVSATTYYLRVSNVTAVAGQTNNMTISNICITPNSAGSSCYNATNISVSLPGNTSSPLTYVNIMRKVASGAALAVSSCVPAATYANAEGWFQFTTLASNQTYTVSATPSGIASGSPANTTATPNLLLQLYTASPCTMTSVTYSSAINNTSAQTCTNASAGTGTENAVFSGLSGNTTYYIRVVNVGTSGTMMLNSISVTCSVPVNDNCSYPIVLTPNSCGATGIGTLEGATADVTQGAVTCGSQGTGAKDVWFTFTANTTWQKISIVPGGSTQMGFEVYSGSCGSLVAVGNSCTIAANVGTTVANYFSISLGTYYLRVFENTGNISASTTFTVNVVNPPQNDECAQAITLGIYGMPSTSYNSAVFNNTCATQSLQAAICGVPDDDVWFSFNTVNGQQYVVSVTGSSDFAPTFIIYSGSCSGAVVNCWNSYLGPGPSFLPTISAAGATVATVPLNYPNGLITGDGNPYYIRVYDFRIGQQTTSTFSINVGIPPANDEITGVVTLTPQATCTDGINASSTGTFLSATRSLPTNTICGGEVDDDVWYKFVANTTNTIITVTPNDSTVDVAFIIIPSPYTNSPLSCKNTFGAGIEETLTQPTSIGTTYFVRVYDPFTGNPVTGAYTGGFNICISTSPQNDDCSGAINLIPNTVCVYTAGTVGGATASGYSTSNCGGSPPNADDDVWYSFVASATTHTVNVSSSVGFDAVIQAYSISCGNLDIGCTNINGIGGSESLVLSSLIIGSTYWVRVFDAGTGMPTTTTFSICITAPVLIFNGVISATYSNVSCYGWNNGIINVSVVGAQGNLTYSWSPSGGSTATASGLTAGTYICTVTDSTGASDTISVILTQPNAITTTITNSNVNCFGGSNGSAAVIPNGGTGTFTYNWIPFGGNSSTANNLMAGTYTVIVTDSNSCIKSSSISITQPVAALTVNNSNITNTLCGSNNGQIYVNITGGTPPYNYLWTNGATTATNQNLAIGNYSLTVTDFKGCIATSPLLTVGMIHSNFNLAFSAIATTGVAPFFAGFNNNTPNMSNYNFTWYWGDATSTASNSPNVTHTFSYAGFYDVSLVAVNNNTGCADTLIKVGYIFVSGTGCSHTAVISPSSNFSGCVGDTLLLTASTNASLNYIYQWNLNSIPIFAASSNTLTVTQTGYYSVTVIQAGCPITSNVVSVNMDTNPPIPLISSTGALIPCVGGSVTLTASFLAGGNYLWNTNSTTQSITVNSPGLYNVIESYGNSSCSSSSSPFFLGTGLSSIPICLVTVDSLSTHNILVWEKTGVGAEVDSFRIYRETMTNIFTNIASVSNDSLSEYHDYAANPNVTSYKYKLATIDTCGSISSLSDFHNTIHLQYLGNGNLQWTLYDIENVGNPVVFYIINRDDNSTGNFLPISTTIPGGNYSYTDINYAAYPNASYRVDVTWSISCNPTRSITTTHSNVIHQNTSVGISQSNFTNSIIIYPNPANLSLTLSSREGMQDVKIYNVLGEIVYNTLVGSASSATIDVSGFAKGFYFMEVSFDASNLLKAKGSVVRKKFVKQ